MTLLELRQLDGILAAARLLSLGAKGYARDHCNGTVEKIDPCGAKLDAYSLGLLSILLSSYGTDSHVLRLLAYLLTVCEHGPGSDAVAAAERMLRSRDQPDSASYFESGREDMLRLQAGGDFEPLSYASLLLAETVSH
ncbi:MAG: hypothetical protein ACR2QQ_10700 [Gammaproteobacteria bacterium]